MALAGIDVVFGHNRKDQYGRFGDGHQRSYVLGIRSSSGERLFFFVCGYVQMMVVQYDRMIALTELVLELKIQTLESDYAVTY